MLASSWVVQDWFLELGCYSLDWVGASKLDRESLSSAAERSIDMARTIL